MVTKRSIQAGLRKKAITARSVKAEPTQPVNGNQSSASNRDVLRRLYAGMLKCRLLAERVRTLTAGRVGPLHFDLGIGSEAIFVGATVELLPEDTMVASPCNFPARIAMGASPSGLLSLARHDKTLHQETAIGGPGSLIFDSFNLGTGFALAQRLEKRRNVVVALGDPDASSERWHQAMKFAGVHKLPVIYVMQSSLAVESTGEGYTPALEELSLLARDYGFPAIIVDGRDAVAVWRVTQESIHRARNGAGPTLIECEPQLAQYDDPLAHMEHYMRKRGLWDEQWKRVTMDGIEEEIARGGLELANKASE